MIWITLVWLHVVPHLFALPNITVDINNTALNDFVTLAENFEDGSLRKSEDHSVRVTGKEKCLMPCEMTAKLIWDEKHSWCSNLQHGMAAHARGTRKLIRDLIDEQQKTLEFLSSQVMELMNKVHSLSSEVQRSNSDMLSLKPLQVHGRDCSDILETLGTVSPKIPSGIYIIQPENADFLFEVFCEMDYMEGGWTVIQRRTDGLTDFKHVWSDYLNGFGPLSGEHWLGLRKLFRIISQRNTRFQLHISLIAQDESTAYASYDSFWLEDESKFFAIHLGRYAGSAGDAFRGYNQGQNQDTAPFSTADVDNDGCFPFCTFDNKSVESCSIHHNNTGWWFNQCGKANLNSSPLDHDRSVQPHIHWDTWTKNGELVNIKSVTMKIRRVEGSNLK
ncbi:hypothetical protein P4O66_016735 [Electrophorus voltai]|uniref:Fibrinogen C-terminal domain-containing protein n=2 Tax=Electrophorus TaxID=8004 RepID=A0A4W4EA32_ELEEL|nr:angiopoietin-related protein 5 [Electrophorus electricus]XP_026859496.1 angiopoietin-related protein 5 [Electrophorus electricus]KAK1788285.1 hypothetical protein P4O66_016735 [Electrophorus voltai]